MIRSFRGKATEDFYDGTDSKAARDVCPQELHENAMEKLELLNAAVRLADLAFPPGNRLERLKGERKGQHSIRINKKYRIVFEWTDDGPADVEIVDYH